MGADYLGLMLAAIVISLTIASHIVKKGVLSFAAAGFWMIFVVFALDTYTTVWDVYYCIFLISSGMVIVCIISPLAWRETSSDNEEVEEPDVAELRHEIEQIEREKNQYNFLYRNKKRRRNEPIRLKKVNFKSLR